MKKQISFLVIISIIGITTIFLATGSAKATQACACIKPSIIPTEILPTDTSTPTLVILPSVTETPTASPTAQVSITTTPPPSPHGDGLSDGRSDGLCSKPPCITPGASIPFAPPATGKGK